MNESQRSAMLAYKKYFFNIQWQKDKTFKH